MTAFQIAKNGIAVGIIFFFIAAILFGIRAVIHKKKKDRVLLLVSICLLLLCFPVYFMIAVKQYGTFDPNQLQQFSVESENLHNGVWDDEIANTDRGQNLSPQLSWEEVPGAEGYVVYMIDPDGFNWIHMKTSTIKGTSLSKGQIERPEKGKNDGPGYVGPYPPFGTHTYEVYVFALKHVKDGYAGTVDRAGDGIDQIESLVDVNENGDIGNIIAVGKLSGTYTK